MSVNYDNLEKINPQEDIYTKEKLVYPRIDIDIKKLKHNAQMALNIARRSNIDIYAVTKVICSKPDLVEAILETGVKTIGDSRVRNLKKLKDIKCEKLLLRLPSISEVTSVVRYADISLNSELETIKALSKVAKDANKIHKVILMIDLGDLREGVLEKDALEISRGIINLPNIQFLGIGTNLSCYGGVIPDEVNLGKLIEIKENIETELGIKLEVVSGGNSSSLYMVLNKTIVKGINNLRLGESVFLGRETGYGQFIPGMFKDVFTLKGELIEIKNKPSKPIGNIGMDAFGNKPSFVDKGEMTRGIISIGKQDVSIDGLIPRDKKIEILGGSSDHIILDLTHCENKYNIGDIVEFNVDYGALLSLMTSEYIYKHII